MKKLVLCGIFTMLSTAIAVADSAPTILYDAQCVVISFGKDGANFKQLASKHVQLEALKKTEIFRDNERIYSVMAHMNTFAKKPVVDLLFEILDVNDQHRIAASGTLYFPDSTPPLLIDGTQLPGSDTQIDMQCMKP